MAVINDHSRQNDKGSKSTRHNNEKVTTEVPPSPSFTVLCYQKVKRVITTKRVPFCCHALRIKLGYTTLPSGGAGDTINWYHPHHPPAKRLQTNHLHDIQRQYYWHKNSYPPKGLGILPSCIFIAMRCKSAARRGTISNPPLITNRLLLEWNQVLC